MSATNTTTNYNLPIFIGADKPSWLADFNGAMNAIDAQMKVNADAIATKSPILTFNDTTEIELDKTGNVVTATLASGVSDKVGRALVTPLSAPAAEQLVSINTNGAQSAVNVGSGLFNDNGTLKAVDLNLTILGSVTPTSGLPSGVTRTGGSISYAFNSDKSIGKIYGNIQYKKSTSGDVTIEVDTGITVPAPAAEYSIVPAGLAFPAGTYHFGAVDLKVKTNGHVYFRGICYGGNATNYYYLFPCIYFFRDFGDTPTP